MAEGDTFVNALVGAVASVLLSGFIPFAPVVGGGIAGYMQGGDRSEGLRVGAVSGVIALIPAILIAFLVFSVFLTVLVGGVAGGAPAGFGVFGALGAVGLLVVGVFGLLYFVGLSAVGGWLGNYVKYDTDVEL